MAVGAGAFRAGALSRGVSLTAGPHVRCACYAITTMSFSSAPHLTGRNLTTPQLAEHQRHPRQQGRWDAITLSVRCGRCQRRRWRVLEVDLPDGSLSAEITEGRHEQSPIMRRDGAAPALRFICASRCGVRRDVRVDRLADAITAARDRGDDQLVLLVDL